MPLVVETGGIFERVTTGEKHGCLSEGTGALVQTAVEAVEFGEIVQTGSVGIAATGQRLDALERGVEGLLAILVVSARTIERAKLVAKSHVFRGGLAAGERDFVAQGEKCLLKSIGICAVSLPDGIDT